jgi:hypothetical protein
MVHRGTPQRFTVPIPDEDLTADNVLNVELKFPEAIRPAPNDSNTRKRSIELSGGSGTSTPEPEYNF